MSTERTHVFMRALGRVTGRKLRSQRVVNAGIQGAGITLKATSRAARALWLQMTGFFFAVLALMLGFAALREYDHFVEGRMGPAKALIGGVFALLFLYFAVTSFWKARA